MANIPQGKSQCYVRLKHSTLEMLKTLALVGGYPTMNTLAAELLEECVRFMADPKRTETPAVLSRLQELGVGAADHHPVHHHARNGAQLSAVPAPFTPYQLAAIKDIIEQSLEKKNGCAPEGKGNGRMVLPRAR